MMVPQGPNLPAISTKLAMALAYQLIQEPYPEGEEILGSAF